ncbi:hypothetical protein QTP88_007744 [Uroleucon formosanum]
MEYVVSVPARPRRCSIYTNYSSWSTSRRVDRITIIAIKHCLSDYFFAKLFFPPNNVSKFPLSCLDHSQHVTYKPTMSWSKCIDDSHELSDEERAELFSLLDKYRAIFNDRPGLNMLYSCRFVVSEDVPFKVKPYPHTLHPAPEDSCCFGFGTWDFSALSAFRLSNHFNFGATLVLTFALSIILINL